MVAIDLDGTLLNTDHQISQSSVEYLRHLHSKGFIVAIATGRTRSSTEEVIQALNLPTGEKGFPLVCLNGACGLKIYDYQEEYKDQADKVLFHNCVPMEVAKKTIELAKNEMGLVTNYYLGLEIYANPTCDKHIKSTEKYMMLTGTKIHYITDNYADVLKRGLPSKMLVFCDPEEIDETYKTVLDSMHEEAHVIKGSPPWFVEILKKDICKGNGLIKLCQSLGVLLEETIAFGDGSNDIEFLQLAGKGIAMKNARSDVKAVANEVTEFTNAEDGVIKTLMKMEQDGALEFSQLK